MRSGAIAVARFGNSKEAQMKTTDNSQATAILHSRPEGSLHKALGVPKGERIPLRKLQWATKNLGTRQAARAALVLRFHYGK
jgi:hypothetical protein